MKTSLSNGDKWITTIVVLSLFTVAYIKSCTNSAKAQAPVQEQTAASSVSITLDESSGRYVRVESLARLPNGCDVSLANVGPPGKRPDSTGFVWAHSVKIIKCPNGEVTTQEGT